MAERLRVHRVFVADTRDNGQYLGVTWHPDSGQFVISHWRDDVCVAATRVGVDDAGELMGLFVNGLTSAASGGVPAPVAVESLVAETRYCPGGR